MQYDWAMTESPELLEPDWNAARAVWLTAGVALNETRSTAQEHLLDELKRAAGMFREMKRVDIADHGRSWNMRDGAQMCRELIQFVSNIDDVALPRLVRGGIRNLNTTMTTLVTGLAELELAFKHAPEVIKVRRRKHEFHDLLVVRLAESFERYTDRKASVTTDYDTSERSGVFVEFVFAFLEHFLPEEEGELNARAIQRALSAHRHHPPDPLED